MATDFVSRQVFDLPEPQPLIVTEHRSVTGWRPTTVAAVQPETALQLGNARLLRQQQGDQRVLRQLVERSAIHQLLGINPPKPCQPSFALGSAEGSLGSYFWLL